MMITRTTTMTSPLFQPLENSTASCCRKRRFEVNCDGSQNSLQVAVSRSENSKLPELSFNRLQLSDQECSGVQRRRFGKFLVREAILDEEFWAAAWLRAEAHCECLSPTRHMDSFKRKFADQEFYALKRRCTGRDGNSLKCSCLVAVKNDEKNARRTVLSSVVGTLDLSVRQFFQGETYPGEVGRSSAVLASQEPFDVHKYGYIANVSVSKFARRHQIASNMMYFAIDVASIAGLKQLFVHVDADNNPAQELYRKTGFKVVEPASTPVARDNKLLMMHMELNCGADNNSSGAGASESSKDD